MAQSTQPEVWLRGPIENIPGLLQPVAHALLQASEEVTELMTNFPDAYLWNRPAQVASAAFHLQHLTGVLDRLFTYAKGESLSAAQMHYLSQEGKPGDEITSQSLVELFKQQVNKAVTELSQTPEHTLTEARGVGRKQLPSTVIGLLVHAAEHTMRHVGQLHVTVQIIQASTFKGL